MTEHLQVRAQRQTHAIRRAFDRLGVGLLSVVLLVWTLLPIYNIIRVSMQEKEEVLSTSVFPVAPSPYAFSVVFRQAYWLLETFWNQMGNSF
jgi:multiple sugar transport system permease protein